MKEKSYILLDMNFDNDMFGIILWKRILMMW